MRTQAQGIMTPFVNYAAKLSTGSSRLIIRKTAYILRVDTPLGTQTEGDEMNQYTLAKLGYRAVMYSHFNIMMTCCCTLI